MSYLPHLSLRALAALCALALTLNLAACDRDDDDAEAEDDAAQEVTEERPDELNADHSSLLETYGSQFGPGDDLLVTLAPLNSLSQLADHIDAPDFFNDVGPEIEAALGFNIFDADSIANAGVELDSSMVVSEVMDSPIYCVTVADADTFDDRIGETLEVVVESDEELSRDTTEIDGQDVHHFGEAVAWIHRYDDTCVIQQAYDSPPPAPEALESFLGAIDDGNRYSDSDTFNAFVGSDATDGLITVYSEDDAFLNEMTAGLPPQAQGMVQGMSDGQAGRLALSDDVLGIRVWSHAEGPMAAMASELMQSDADVDWAPFVTDELSAALRLSLHGPTLMGMAEDAINDMMGAMAAEFMASMPEGVQDEADADGDEVRFSDDMRDLITGHAALFFYDLDDPTAAMADPEGFAHAEALVAIQLGQPDMVRDMIGEFEPMLGEFGAEMRPLHTDDGEHDGIHVIAGDAVPAWIALSDDLLIIAPRGLSEEGLAAMIDNGNGAVADSKLGDVLLDDQFNGIYATSGLWSVLDATSEEPTLQDQLDEGRLTLQAGDDSFHIDIDATPAGGLLSLIMEL